MSVPPSSHVGKPTGRLTAEFSWQRLRSKALPVRACANRAIAQFVLKGLMLLLMSGNGAAGLRALFLAFSVVATMYLGVSGFREIARENPLGAVVHFNTDHALLCSQQADARRTIRDDTECVLDSNILYQTLKLFVLNGDILEQATPCPAADPRCALKGSAAPIISHWKIHAARLLGAGFSLVALLQLFGKFLDDGVQRFVRLVIRGFAVEHLLICGFGEKGRAYLSSCQPTARRHRVDRPPVPAEGNVAAWLPRTLCGIRSALAQRRRRVWHWMIAPPVIVMDPQADTQDQAWCLRHGAILLQGDGLDASTLKQCRALRASRILALMGEDQANLKLLSQIRLLAASGRHDGSAAAAAGADLLVQVHIQSPGLRRMVSADAPRIQDAGAMRALEVRYFGVMQAVARAFLLEQQPYALARLRGHARLHLVFCERGIFLEELLHLLIQQFPCAGLDAPLFTVLCREQPDEVEARLKSRYPGWWSTGVALRFLAHPAGCDFTPEQLSQVECPDHSTAAHCVPVTCLVVAGDDDAANAELAISLRHATARHHRCLAPIYFLQHRATALDRHHRSADVTIRLDDVVQPIGDLRAHCTIETLDGKDGWIEEFAQNLHFNYLTSTAQAAQDKAEGTGSNVAAKRREDAPPGAREPYRVEWSRLTDEMRESNRQVALHLPHKLAALDMVLTPLSEDADEAIRQGVGSAPPADQMQTLAELEHARWMSERQAGGESRAEIRDVRRRGHPNLCAYDALSQKDKQKDIDSVTWQIRQGCRRVGFALQDTVCLPVLALEGNPSVKALQNSVRHEIGAARAQAGARAARDPGIAPLPRITLVAAWSSDTARQAIEGLEGYQQLLLVSCQRRTGSDAEVSLDARWKEAAQTGQASNSGVGGMAAAPAEQPVLQWILEQSTPGSWLDETQAVGHPARFAEQEEIAIRQRFRLPASRGAHAGQPLLR